MNVQEAKDWVDNLRGDFHAVTDLWVYTGDFELEPGDEVGLRYIERESKVFINYDDRPNPNILFEMPNCTYGDYVGSVISKSNFQVLTSEEFLKDNDLPDYIKGYGAYYSYALYYSLCTATQTQLDNLKAIVEELVDYPALSDDAWTELEYETINNDIYEFLAQEVAWAIERKDREEVLEWYEGEEIQIGDLLFDMICNETHGYIETFVEGVDQVVYEKDVDWFAQKVIETYEREVNDE